MYTGEFSSLCIFQSSTPNQQLWIHKAATEKAASSSKFSAVLSRTYTTETAPAYRIQHALGTDGGGGGDARGSALIPVLKDFCNATLVVLGTVMWHPR